MLEHEPTSGAEGTDETQSQERDAGGDTTRSETVPEAAPNPAGEASVTEERRGSAVRAAGPPPEPEPPAPPMAPAASAIPAAGDAAEAAGGQEPGTAPAEPAVKATFQPPVVVFQPPATAEEGSGERNGAAAAVREAGAPPEEEDEDEDDGPESRGARRRRRRGGRGRGRTRAGDDAPEDIEPSASPSAAEPEQAASEDEGEAAGRQDVEAVEESAGEEAENGATRRRRRRRRRGGASEATPGEPAESRRNDDPPNTVVKVREPRAGGSGETEVQSVKGSTRLEAKKQRRREGREQGRRRPPIVTESEFLARRESVKRDLVVRRSGERTQIAVLEDDVLVEHYVDRSSHQSLVGNVYLGRVQNVLPSMEAAFVDIGKGRNAVLYAGEVNWDASGLEGQPKRIESALKSGQSVLVQVTKDPVGHKGARLTSQISLPGRYLVYVPDGSMTGISRKLPDKERARLKQILKQVMPEDAGVIVRTAAEGASEEELQRDISRLAAQWAAIAKRAKAATAPKLLSSEPDLTVRVVRDIFNEDFSGLVVSGEEAWNTVQEYVDYVAPHLAERLEHWTREEDLFQAYRVEEQIAKALERKVWLPSGGSLVIDRTEAMTVIDVNTGKFTGQGGNLEETVTKNNLEAAEEIVRQLRLRDIGGIIVIDFIDMVLESNRELVLRRMLECLARDRTKHQVAEVTSLGLVQMTRKRVGQGLLEAFSQVCECCTGRGLLISTDAPAVKQGGNGGGRKRKGGEKDKAEKTEKAEKADKAEKAGKSDKAGKSEKKKSTKSKTAEGDKSTSAGGEHPQDPDSQAATVQEASGDPTASDAAGTREPSEDGAEDQAGEEEQPRAKRRRTRRTKSTSEDAVGAEATP